MKRTFNFVASLLITVAMEAQTINVHKADGSVVKFLSSEVEYIAFSEEEQSGEQSGEQTGEQGGEQFAYTICPDSNHPHMINLGLPSGTMWACCNVGASTPEDYGNYYAWGETQPKGVYNDVTYLLYIGEDFTGDGWFDKDYTIMDIGSDIAGTSCDAATANWGAPWRMPSLTQIKELFSNTTSTWATQNGVNGRRFTGPNGGTIFLPVAGTRVGDKLSNAGLYGYYWSSALGDSHPSQAYYLYLDTVGEYLFNEPIDNRISGDTVRPVR